jgi:HD-GYP domain-containing protein (c-di-GMP phosphodiesterase class II)
VPVAFLSENERENLNIVAGTLTSAERHIINHHIESTINMLEAIPWPNHLRNVTEYAGGHHERIDGKGYPKGLKGQDMSVQARILAIADIFEALTAADRPYKSPMKLSQSLGILKKMSQEGHIDPDLFEVFVSHKVYLDYGKAFLDEAQLDAP